MVPHQILTPDLALRQPRRFAYMSPARYVSRDALHTCPRSGQRPDIYGDILDGLAGTRRPLPNRARYLPSLGCCRLFVGCLLVAGCWLSEERSERGNKGRGPL